MGKYCEGLRILIDMDDVMESLLSAWVAFLNKKYGLSVDPEDVVQWDMKESFPSLNNEELYRPLNLRSFWMTVRPKPGAEHYVKRLIDDGHQVFVCTSSHYRALQDKMEVVLFRYFPFLKWSNVIVTAHKYLIKADVLVDDGVHNLMSGDYRKILMDAPHNRSFAAEEHDMIRVNSWQEIYNVISQIDSEVSKESEELHGNRN